jgi:glucosamine--fructose-6-phosphate aminotransferase (isomerizing)
MLLKKGLIMCGIVGYSGKRNGINIVLEGLSRLEYRGYDSAGICFQDGDQLKIIKKEGKLENLKKILIDQKSNSQHVIGHTRWATHGGVTDFNAHPHGDEKLAVVHNGIIENARDLKQTLLKEGFKFQSETDSEVFFVLLKKLTSKGIEIKKAIAEAFNLVKGNSAFVIIDKNLNSIYSIKRGAPLVVGENTIEGDIFVSSDPYALVGFTNKIYFPEDAVICEGHFAKTGNRLNFYELDGQQSLRFKLQEKELKLEVASKGEFEHFMLKEIYEQPALIKNLEHIYKSPQVIEKLKKIKSFNPKFIHIVACGTAWHAGLTFKKYLEDETGIRVNVEVASEFRYRNPILSKEDLAIFVSQSGETADTLASQELCKKAGLKTISIVNVEGSTLYRNCDENLLTFAGPEIGVASTKAFTQQVLTGFILAKSLNQKNDIQNSWVEISKLQTSFQDVLDRISEIKKIAKEIYNQKGFIYTGRGIDYPIALEGALKLKEIAYVHAEGYAAGELKHGPIALIDDRMVNVAIVTPELFEKTFSNAQEVKARKGAIVIIGPEKNEELEEIADFYFPLNLKGLSQLHPLLTNLVLQILAYEIAKLKGTDIDKPRNLAKSVTVE